MTGGKVLYVTGEESATQIKLRATRLGVDGEKFYIYPETDMSAIRKTIEEIRPNTLLLTRSKQ